MGEEDAEEFNRRLCKKNRKLFDVDGNIMSKKDIEEDYLERLVTSVAFDNGRLSLREKYLENRN